MISSFTPSLFITQNVLLHSSNFATKVSKNERERERELSEHMPKSRLSIASSRSAKHHTFSGTKVPEQVLITLIETFSLS